MSTLIIAQEKCETPSETTLDKNAINITKCSIEDVKNALETDENKPISIRKHVVRKAKNNINIRSNNKIKKIKNNTLLVEKLNIDQNALLALKKIPFHLVEQIPLFSKCKNTPLVKQSKCFEEQMINHIIKNFNYPKIALANNIQGKVLIQFTIDKNGNVVSIKKRGPKNGAVLEKEAERLINKLPKFIPGKHHGSNVNVKYALPIMFRTPNNNS